MLVPVAICHILRSRNTIIWAIRSCRKSFLSNADKVAEYALGYMVCPTACKRRFPLFYGAALFLSTNRIFCGKTTAENTVFVLYNKSDAALHDRTVDLFFNSKIICPLYFSQFF